MGNALSTIDCGGILRGGNDNLLSEIGTALSCSVGSGSARTGTYSLEFSKDPHDGMQYVDLLSADTGAGTGSGSEDASFRQASARVYLWGATVTSWKDTNNRGVQYNAKEQLFLSSQAVFDGKKAIRGGIPVVFPQFGAKKLTENSSMSQHGFARTSLWTYDEDSSYADANSATAVFTLESSEATKAVWPHKFKLSYRVTLRAGQLETELSITNTDVSDYDVQALLHTYLRVPDITTVAVGGLQGIRYIDQLVHPTATTAPNCDEHGGVQNGVETRGAIGIDAEVDRIMIGAASTTVSRSTNALDADQPPGVTSIKSMQCDTVFWNGWKDKCHRLADMDNDAYEHYVCVEPGVGIHTPMTIKRGDTLHLKQVLSSAGYTKAQAETLARALPEANADADDDAAAVGGDASISFDASFEDSANEVTAL
eukprot:GSChrysophyteH1.ASY1.ANO1.563.1 assembled CDS